MVPVDAIVRALDLEPLAEDRYRAPNVDSGHQVVFGGQLLAQSLVAAQLGNEGKAVKTLHTVFARSASPEIPVEISVDRIHAGRAMASSSVTISQGDRICTRSVVLMSADEPDLIRHGTEPPLVPPPDEDYPTPAGEWAIQMLGGVDISDPNEVAPAKLDVWTRFPGAPADLVINQGLLAFATDGFLIGTAMLPHEGVGQAQAHQTISTGVLSHTITFHEPFSAAEWLLLAHQVPYAGRGRSYGSADVFTDAGQLVASFVQDAMIRSMGDGQPAGGRL
jgi:acyl-CoA thioesterase